MGINWAGAAAGAAAGVNQYTQAIIEDSVSARREKRMAQYRSEEQGVQFAQQDAVQARGFEHDAAIREADAERQTLGAQAKIEREDALLADERRYTEGQKEVDHRRKIDGELVLENFKAQNNPQGVNIVNNMGGSNEFTDKLDAADGEEFVRMRNAAVSAGRAEATLDVLEQIGASTDTGKVPALLAKAGEYLGTEAGASMQAYQAAVVPMILEQTSKLEGVISDKDMSVIESSMPSFSTDPRANKIILGILRRGMNDAKLMYNEANEHLKSIPEGEHFGLRNWTPSLSRMTTPTAEAQSSLDAAANPAAVLSDFEKWEASRGGN